MFFIYSKLSTPSQVHRKPLRLSPAQPNISSVTKIGHAHDNSADSEDVAGVSQRSEHAHFIFRFENGPGNQSFFSIHDQNTAETSQPQAQPTDD